MNYKREATNNPLLSRGGVAEGRGGAGQEKSFLNLTNTTPSARNLDASQHFICVHPPLLC
jgi:hypothetical protein